MSERRRRGRAPAWRGRVQRVTRLTPHMIRVVLGGEGLHGFDVGEYTDHYVKLLFPPDGVTYPEPFNLRQVRDEMPRDTWPIMRTYTVRHWNPASHELSIDVVHHGDRGLAGPWAANVQPGDEIYFVGPGGGFSPDPAADWLLLAGDESALPAIAVTLEQLPAHVRAYAYIEVDGADEVQAIGAGDDASVTWLHRDGAAVGDALVEAVRSFEPLAGHGQAFVHGEANFVKQLRRLLLDEQDLPRDRLSASGYWRNGLDEDGWQAAKRTERAAPPAE